MIFLHLFLQFFKTGLFAVGGGLATLPFLREMAQRYAWFSMEDLVDMIAISESTPGPIGVNMATFAGFNAAGVGGGILATGALVLPSIVVVVLIASFLERFQNSQIVQRGFALLRVAAAGLIAGAMFEVVLLSLLDLDLYGASGVFWDLVRFPALLLFACLVFLIRRFPRVHPAFFILGSAVVGVLLKL